MMEEVRGMFPSIATRFDKLENSKALEVGLNKSSYGKGYPKWRRYLLHQSILKVMPGCGFSYYNKIMLIWDGPSSWNNSIYDMVQPNFFGDLTKLRQMVSVRDYQAQFERLLTGVGRVTPEQQVSCFISGLKDSIRFDVLAARPTTLLEAIGLARLYEARNNSWRWSMIPESKSSHSFKSSASTPSTLPVRRLTPTELKERHDKGLCFNCNEKFSPGHRCKKFFVIESCWQGDGDIEMEIEGERESTHDELEVSLHAITGHTPGRIMKVKGKVGGEEVTALVDSGSTHNFLSTKLAQRVGLKPTKDGQFKVAVVNGQTLVSPGKCFAVSLMLQDVPLQIDFYLLPIDGYEVILGTQWLSILGIIMWDFFHFCMKFWVNGREVLLQGIPPLVRNSTHNRVIKKNH
uniref:Uncharacterized protein n=1 Tax=Nelumbo nucifera TaxID=4432 RepID=A0A822XH94_NELNU|nr:TPA_asm: hypothetical protein HUJ06_021223 [Nelumbo nucifera]